MNKNPLIQLETFGQSIWLDYIKRDMFKSGKLKKLIDDDGLKGMTSNPDIFEKSIAESHDYDTSIKSLVKEGKNVEDIYRNLTIQDVQSAADEFRSLYDKLKSADGYVSLEVNPHLAHETEKTIDEARALWKALDRPNVFIKVPATKEGIPAIKQLISEGININVTLLFGLDRYKEVAHAYIEGLEERVRQKKSIDRIASVASFFLSRIDALIDPELEKQKAKSLEGQVAIASAKLAYQIYNEIFNSDRFKELAAQGAHTQRLLWASTSTKNKSYSDVMYIEALIGPHTVNTIPVETLDAYRDHGKPKATLSLDVDKAKQTFETLPTLGIDMKKITQQLEDEGVAKFNKAYDKLIDTLTSNFVKA